MFYFLSGKEVRSFREDVIKRCSMRHEQSPTMFQECTILNLFYVENWAYWLMLDIMCSIWCRYTQILKIYFQFYSHASNSSTKEWHSWFSCRQDEFLWVVSSALIRIGRGLETIYTRTANASVHCPARAAWLTSKHLKAFQAKEFSGCECLISG